MTNLNRRVVIIDAHDVTRRTVRELLEGNTRYDLAGEASDCESGLDIIRQTKPEIAIIDARIFESEYWKFTDDPRRASRLKILLVATDYQDETMANVLRAGGRGFILESDIRRCLNVALDALSMQRTYFSIPISCKLLDQVLANSSRVLISKLTRREVEVLQSICNGRLNKETAERLEISLKTVETHRSNAIRKLNLRTTADLVRFAIKAELIDA